LTPEQPQPLPSKFPDTPFLEQRGGEVIYFDMNGGTVHQVNFPKILV